MKQLVFRAIGDDSRSATPLKLATRRSAVQASLKQKRVAQQAVLPRDPVQEGGKLVKRLPFRQSHPNRQPKPPRSYQIVAAIGSPGQKTLNPDQSVPLRENKA